MKPATVTSSLANPLDRVNKMKLPEFQDAVMNMQQLQEAAQTLLDRLNAFLPMDYYVFSQIWRACQDQTPVPNPLDLLQRQVLTDLFTTEAIARL